VDLMDYGPALGRRFRALKLWLVLSYFGSEGIASRIRHHCDLASTFSTWVEAAPHWHLLAPQSLSVAVFRHAPPHVGAADLDPHNQRILDRVNASGEVFLSRTRVRGHLALRIAVGNLRTEQRHLTRAWQLLQEAATTESLNSNRNRERERGK
jgi:aromatic-L-amino-acid/L-tryptophan decarboxylase